jgi:hypothetical protein
MININYEHLIEQIELMKTQAQVLKESCEKDTGSNESIFVSNLINDLQCVKSSYERLLQIQNSKRKQKYKIGQTVFYAHEGTIEKDRVTDYDFMHNTYDLEAALHVPEKELFATKKEAIQNQLSFWATIAAEYAEEHNNPNNPDE